MGGQPTWVYGVFLAFSGCVVSNIGINFQKLAHTKLIESGSSESYATHPIWILGAFPFNSIQLFIATKLPELVFA
jgi:hypothetical protein